MDGIQNMYRGLITDSLGKQPMAPDSVANQDASSSCDD